MSYYFYEDLFQLCAKLKMKNSLQNKRRHTIAKMKFVMQNVKSNKTKKQQNNHQATRNKQKKEQNE